MHARVRIVQTAAVGAEHVAALGLRQVAQELVMGIREDGPHALEEPIDLAVAPEEYAPQHAGRHSFRVRLSVAEGERRAPGTTEQQPALDTELAAQSLDIGDEMGGGVVVQAAERTGSSGAALVEQHDPPEAWVEEPAMDGARARAGTAVKEQRRQAAGVARLLPIHRMTRAPGEIAGAIRGNLGEEFPP